MEGYKRVQARHQTDEILDTDSLNATDSGAVGPSDQTAQATEETC